MSKTEAFALFGGTPAFAQAKPTGNLYQPDIESFFEYSRRLFQSKQYTDDGELCRLFERLLAEFHEVERVVCMASGFWGHVLAFTHVALPGRTEIIAPAFGYRRTDDMIAWAGYVPHFCDVDRETLGPSVDTISTAINDQTALILAPHPMVNCCDAWGIEQLGRAHGIPVVFDSVEAAYRSQNNKRIGGFGSAEVFSTHATKLLNSFEGGYVTTNDCDLAEELDNAKRHGIAPGGCVKDIRGLNSKLNEIHAAMGLASLERVEEQVALHRRKYKKYVTGLQTISGLTVVQHDEAARPDYRLVVLRIEDEWPLSREHTLRLLEAENILARPYYIPLHHKLVEYPRICPELPVTETISGHYFVLPSGALVSESDVERIIQILARIARCGANIRSQWPTK
jgi:dTDP-4-amino-4,6-dideoxygalactose transaminase